MLIINYFERCGGAGIFSLRFLLSDICLQLSNKINLNFFCSKFYPKCLWKLICNIAIVFFQFKPQPKALATGRKTNFGMLVPNWLKQMVANSVGNGTSGAWDRELAREYDGGGV